MQDPSLKLALTMLSTNPKQRSDFYSTSLLAAQGKFNAISPNIWNSFDYREKLDILDVIPLHLPVDLYAHLLPDTTHFLDWYRARSLKIIHMTGDLKLAKSLMQMALTNKTDANPEASELSKLLSFILAFEGFQQLLIRFLENSRLWEQDFDTVPDSHEDISVHSRALEGTVEYRKGLLLQVLQKTTLDDFISFWTTGNLEAIAMPLSENWFFGLLLVQPELLNGVELSDQVATAISSKLFEHSKSVSHSCWFSTPILNYRHQAIQNQLITKSHKMRQLDNQTLKHIINSLSSGNAENCLMSLRELGYEFSSRKDLEQFLNSLLNDIQQIDLVGSGETMSWSWLDKVLDGKLREFPNLDLNLLFECLSQLANSQ